MFYSHEILTSPEHGVATIWLVATLGSRSVSRRVNRKAIQDVDVPEACRVIINPDAPMALRLQGSLLYGVSKVYNQQCGYTLLDAQAMHDRMLSMLKVMPGGGLDPAAGRAKSNHLIVPYDPSFLPETGLPGLDIDFSVIHGMVDGSSDQGSRVWRKSPDLKQSGSSQVGRIQLDLPSDDLMRDVNTLGFDGGINSSFQKRGVSGRMRDAGPGNEEGILLQPDFEFDEDGNIVELGASRMSLQKGRGSTVGPRESEDPLLTEGGEDKISNEVAAFARQDDMVDRGTHTNESNIFSEAEHPDGHEELIHAQEARVRHARRLVKTIIPDDETALRNMDLAQWNEEYRENMVQALKLKQQNKVPTQAKKNAAFWVFGQGFGSVGVGLGMQREAHPLKRFSGEELYDAVCEEIRQSGRKHTHAIDEDIDDDNDDDPNERRVCAKDGQEENLGRSDTDHLKLDVEFGRQAPSSVYDDHSSQMPWNVTASVQSSHRGHRFGSVGEFSGLPESAGLRTSRPRSRLASASPLAGHRYLDRRERLSSLSIPGNAGDELGDLGHLDLTDYLKGEFATDRENLCTISSARRAALTSTLGLESLNFFEFIKSKIGAPPGTVGDTSAKGTQGNSARGPIRATTGQIAFSTLLLPEKTTRAVATQGLMNVLILATKGVLAVHQESHQDDRTEGWGIRYRYGEILLRLSGM